MFSNWNGQILAICKSVVVNNGEDNYNIYVESEIDETRYHFTYNGVL